MERPVMMFSSAVRVNSKHVQRIFILSVVGIIILLLAYRYMAPQPKQNLLHFNPVSREESRELQGKSLKFANRQFYLNGKQLRILSGAMHYFRVLPEYWEDRMQKMKACGLNTLETYVPWNLHEEIPGKFNFKGRLDLRKYIQLAQEQGLYVILRPGPYICSEWDFGGLPSWLLSNPMMKVRSNYPMYQEAVKNYFSSLLSLVSDLQFSRGGPIIAFQIENEYYSYSTETEHLLFIKNLLKKAGIEELLLTSDGYFPERLNFHKHALPTANFQTFEPNGTLHFDLIVKQNTDFPLMVMEYWSGWFDHWAKPHKGLKLDKFEKNVKKILEKGASINFYMFHGGTNFGFMAGANYFKRTGYNPDVTSYDYDCPLSEAGDITPKYTKIRELLLELVYKPMGITSLPDVPPNIQKKSYGSILAQEMMAWNDMLTLVGPVRSKKIVPMEMLNINNKAGQSYGYIVYRNRLKSGERLSFNGRVFDRAQVLLNGVEIDSFNYTDTAHVTKLPQSNEEKIVDIVVENTGRVNFVRFGSNVLNIQRKGILDDILLDNVVLDSWEIYPLDFKVPYLTKLSTSKLWKKYEQQLNKPAVYRAILMVKDETPKDTFLLMEGWSKGVVFINGFNLGRYWEKGPQKTLYVPAPVLQPNNNEILVFEHNRAGGKMTFQDTHILE